jgi:probable HAF family extracellular repeat protein
VIGLPLDAAVVGTVLVQTKDGCEAAVIRGNDRERRVLHRPQAAAVCPRLVVGPAVAGQVTLLDTLPDGHSAAANAINNRDQVTGRADTSGLTHAVVWDNGQVTDLGTLPGDDTSIGTALNDAGQVVGVSWPNYLHDGSVHAFLYTDGIMIDLGNLGGRDTRATGINAAGQVVGSSSLSLFSHHAFLYSDGTMTDLNTLIDPESGWTLYDVNGINDAGQIVGNGTGPDGYLHAFVLTPESEPLKQDQALFLHDPGLVRVQVSWVGSSTSVSSATAIDPGIRLLLGNRAGNFEMFVQL